MFWCIKAWFSLATQAQAQTQTQASQAYFIVKTVQRNDKHKRKVSKNFLLSCACVCACACVASENLALPFLC